MGDSGKRKLSAKEIISDIRSGADSVGLKNKYGLSDKSLESVLGKLSAAGALTETDMIRLKSGFQEAPALREPPRSAQWRCPACNVAQPQEMSECPSCGVIVAKFAAHQSEARPGPASFTTRHDGSDSSAAGGWTYVVWSIVVLAAVAGGIIAWSLHRSSQKAEIVALERMTSQSSQEIAGQSGDMVSQEETSSIAYPPGVMESFKAFESDRMSAGDSSQTAPAQTQQPTESKPPTASTKYVTGVLRQFNSGNFKAEVVEASKTHPVLFQFYSDT